MKHIVIGILAHVDAGKTTLSEGFLFSAGIIKTPGRVDKKNTFLDTYALERKRGITIFSKQAEITVFGTEITLLDTPGHTDLQAETERTLSVLDYAILLVSAAEGVRAHTLTLWKLLRKNNIPTFVFVNKMDSTVKTEKELLAEIRQKLGTSVIPIGKDGAAPETFEDIALLDEETMETYLETGIINKETIRTLIGKRKLFPCFFGSALKGEGVEDLLHALAELTEAEHYPENFSGRIYKITRDPSGTRLVHLKITGGSLSVKEQIHGEKINQIRIYSGEKYKTKETAVAGEICAVTGLTGLFAGDGIGEKEGENIGTSDRRVMTYRLLLPEDTDAAAFFPKLLELTEEIPELGAGFREETKEITLSLTGEVQKEILTNLIEEKHGITVDFGEGNVLYKETIQGEAIGVGHFEPLRHYAEVQLLLEEGEPDTGLSFEAKLSEDELAANWRKAVLTHLEEKEHKGVLTGSPITDMKISLLAGRAHLKHTEGGDFRQAVYRAVRNGLMKAKSVLLEPVYDFRLELPEKVIGRAMSDLSAMHGTFGTPETGGGMAVLTGKVPVACFKDYELTLRSYTAGEGRIFLEPSGYAPCHNAEEVIAEKAYYPEADTENTADSVFCSHGAGFVVPWNEVENYMHLPLKKKTEEENDEDEKEAFLRYAKQAERQTGSRKEERFLGTEEIDTLLHSATAANKKKEEESKRNRWKKRKTEPVYPTNVEYNGETKTKEHRKGGKDYLLVDGYNIIFAWEDLKTLADVNLDSARDKLIEKMGNYGAYKGIETILVFDAYKVKGGKESVLTYGNLTVIYTKEAETADEYIAKATDNLKKEGRVTVATSDGLVQMIIFGSGATRLSAADLYREALFTEEKMREEHSKILTQE